MVGLLADAAMHFTAGYAFSTLDYLMYRRGNPKKERIETKMGVLNAMDRILTSYDHERGIDELNTEENLNKENLNTPLENIVLDKTSSQYANNIATVKEYFINMNLQKHDVGILKKIEYGFKNFFKKERINNRSIWGKLVFASAIEIGYDSLFGFSYYTNVLKESPVAAFANNTYQIPVFLAGLIAGKWQNIVLQRIAVSGDERKIDKKIDQLIKATPILDLVQDYMPPAEVEKRMKNEKIAGIKKTKLTRKGRKLYKKIGEAVDDILHYRQNRKDKAEKEDQERTDKFEDLTRDS